MPILYKNGPIIAEVDKDDGTTVDIELERDE
jgi:hypothetical protein